jgi:MFS transporter, DHA1 family, multidrug resistance protein
MRAEAGRREFMAQVTVFMALIAIAIDLVLPAFPEVRRAFSMPSDSTHVTWVITVFFLGIAVGPWLFGPASDRFGRRPMLFASLGLYILGGLLSALASSWPLLIAARFVWGIGAAGPRTLTNAMVRDRFEGDVMARLMSFIMAVFLIVPIIAPAIGAGLIEIFPWRSVFVAPVVIAILMAVWALRLPETLPVERRRPFTWRAVGEASREVFRNRTTLSFMFANMFTYAILTAYLGASEVIMEDVYERGDLFPLFFGVLGVFFALNSLNNARRVKNVGLYHHLRRSVHFGSVAAIAFVLVSFTGGGKPNFWIFAIALALLIPVAQGLGPLANTAAMTPLPHIAGTASSVITTITTAGGALLGGVANSTFDGTVRSFAAWSTGFFALSTLLILRATREVSPT